MNEHDEDMPVEGLTTLTRRVRPQRDLWPGIEAKIKARPRRRHGLMQFAVAAGMVMGLAGIFSLQLARAPVAGPAQVATIDPATLGDDSRAIVKANLAIVKSAEDQLRHALERKPDSPALKQLLASTENRGRALRALL